MTITDDRIIYDDLTRGQAINFLVKCGFDREILSAKSDDQIAVAYDIAQRKEEEVRIFQGNKGDDSDV